MKTFWKYIFPVIFGLMVYTSIRLVTDTTTGEKFWKRAWQVNAIEIVFVVVMAFVFDRIIRRFEKKFSAQNTRPSAKNMLTEFGTIFIVLMVILNPVVVIIHILIKSPVKWSDIAIADILVLLYTFLHYAIVRSNGLFRAYIEQQLQMEKIRSNQLQTELKFLKAQYHPHFLFNALNTIYFQMDENVAEAKKSVEKFSELLRYQLYDQQQQVPIHQEIQYLQHFIDLQKVRSSDKLQLQVYFDPSLAEQRVYPLLFLPLVENAFKYVGGDYRMKIEATNGSHQVKFYIENSVPTVIPVRKEGGIGLENLKRRLELLYPGKYAFEYKKEGDMFCASLAVTIEH